MAFPLSNEVGTIVVMVFFMAAYLTFSNNFHFSERRTTDIDKMFYESQHNNQLREAIPVPGPRGQSVRKVRAVDEDSRPGAAPTRTKSLSEYFDAVPDDAWPPKHAVYLGSLEKPPPRQPTPPEDECIYESIQGHKWRYCLPRLLTISCINCGTTSLGAYLDGHAHLSVGTKKEHKYFVIKCSDAKQGADYVCDTKEYTLEFPSLPLGCEWNEISGQASGMRRDFSKAFANMQCPSMSTADKAAAVANDAWEYVWGLDISPKYFFVEGAARRIHDMMPNARFLALLRNPVDRHLSHIESKYRIQMNGGGRRGSGGVQISGEVFHSCVDAVARLWGLEPSGEGEGPDACSDDMLEKTATYLEDEKSYSHYIRHFRTWFDLFGKDKFLFISDQTLHDESVRQQLMNEISVFAGVPTYEYPQNSPLYGATDTAHASTKKWEISRGLRKVLWNIFELDKHNAELYAELGHDFGWEANPQ